jgi:uncharacterized protein (DUF2147 family)
MAQKTLSIICAALLCCSLSASAEPTSEADRILGTWVTGDKRSHIEVYKKNDKYYGKVIALEKPVYGPEDPEAGKPIRDRHNKDPKLQKRAMMGIDVVSNFKFDGKKSWVKGTVYDPDTGKTYKSKITLTGNDSMNLRGYIGISLIGQTTVWKRYKGEKPKEVKQEEAQGKHDKNT